MSQPTKMTVAQLKEELGKHPDDMMVTVLREPDDPPELNGPVDIRRVRVLWSSGGFVPHEKGDAEVLVLSAYEDPFNEDD